MGDRSKTNAQLLAEIGDLRRRLEQVDEERASESEDQTGSIGESPRGEQDAIRTIIDGIPYAVLVIDRDYRVRFSNRAARATSGRDPEAQCLKCHQVSHDRDLPCDGDDHPCPLDAAIVDKAPTVVQHVHYDKGGVARTVEVHATPIFDENREVTGIIESIIDVTGRERAREEHTEHLHYLESIRRISDAIRRTLDLKEAIRRVVEVVREIFGADRAWLLHPADPTAASWRVPVESTRPEWPGAFQQGRDIAYDDEARQIVTNALASDTAVVYGVDNPMPGDPGWLSEFSIRSQMIVAIRPKGERAWLLGVHQCDHARVWTASERALFVGIGGRVADALGNMLLHQNLEQSELRYRTLFEQSQFAVMIIDPETARLIEFNEKAARQLGYTREEFAKLRLPDLEAVESVSDIKRHISKIARDGADEFETVHITKSGERLDVLVTARVIKLSDRRLLYAIVQDVTEGKRAQETAAERERALSTLMSNLPGMAYRCRNDPAWTMEFVSDGCFELTGYQPDELLENRATSYAELIHADDREQVWDKVQTAVRNHEPFQLVYRITTAAGEEKWVWEMGCGVNSPTGNLLALEGFITDVTERKRAEEERRRLEEQVQHAQKLESLGVLAGGIAHDFNNLLVGILGNVDLALDDIPNDSPALDSLRGIETAAKRAADLTRQMLAYSGKGRFVVEALDLNHVVQEMTRLLEVSISKKAVIKYDFAEDLPRVEADSAQIRQVVMNLITNASEAIGDQSGVISISTGSMFCGRNYLRGAYLNEDLSEGRYVHLEVADTGCGMNAETQQRIFDPFFTTKFTGRGLGLAAVQGIIRGHSGALMLYSEPGRGTTFKVLLPALTHPVAKRAHFPSAEEDWRHEGTVLLVDDDEIVRMVAARMLETAGFDVLTAAGGPEALDIYRRRANEISCVVLDMTMPEMDGEDVFRELRRIRDDVCVVLSSGYNEQEVIRRFAGREFGGFVQKPYERAQLLQAMRKAMENSSGGAARRPDN